MQGSMIPEQKALLDKINQKVNLIATHCFFPENSMANKRQTYQASDASRVKAGITHLNLLTENECKIQVF